jgi:hypothetical protein
MAHQSGFHSANMTIEHNREGTLQGTAYARSQLATATGSDRATVEMLTVTNYRLATQLEASQAYIKNLNDEFGDLNPKMKPAWQEQRPAKTMSNDN